jgi:antitoxin VapB
MTKSTVFTTNKSQAVRLLKPVALPDNVKQVEITKIGHSRLISPVGRSWDAFFDNVKVSDDFMQERVQPEPEKREQF